MNRAPLASTWAVRDTTSIFIFTASPRGQRGVPRTSCAWPKVLSTHKRPTDKHHWLSLPNRNRQDAIKESAGKPPCPPLVRPFLLPALLRWFSRCLWWAAFLRRLSCCRRRVRPPQCLTALPN